LGQTPNGTRSYAEGTQLVIDEEVSRLLAEAADRAGSILIERRQALDAVIDLLLERETVSGTELMDVVRRSVEAQSVATTS
jgi:cell division protease FtsH